MKYYLLLVYLTVGLAAFYYFTVFFHIFFNIFGDKVTVNQSFIPFYGWFVGLRPNKKQKTEEIIETPKEKKSSVRKTHIIRRATKKKL